MPEALQPERLEKLLADMNRRLQILEATSRVGLNRVRFAWSTGDADVTSFGAYQTGPAGASWQASDGSTGVGYPAVTLELNTKVLVFMQHTTQKVANDPTFRCFSWSSGVRKTPPGTPTGSWPSGDPLMAVPMTHGPTSEGNPTTQLLVGRADLTPGTYTIQMSILFTDSNPAALNQPKIVEPFLMVIPID